MKTTKTYESAIREKYLSDKNSGELRPNLFNLTRGNLRTVCLNLIDETLSDDDQLVFKNYFKVGKNKDLRRQVENYDIEGFRPIYNFLKGDTESIQSFDALELIAVIINFRLRPYKKYRNGKIENEEIESVEYISDLENGKSTIVVKPKNKKFFLWYRTMSATNKILLYIGVVMLIAFGSISTKHILKNETRWMVWQEDHYVEVEFDTEKHKVNQLKLYKEDRINLFKKITPVCDSTKFFNEDGSVNIWYGKNRNKELEYFTALGLHPETGKTLKPITQYMIDKYICD
ncbi:hypothetical protein [Psychroserpens mesophilus]|uniref:hypothetical protein n=1 Tax=Psychroserpens mesophilus TaxID=325473 RepID=UPI003F4993BE